ncbi:MAG: metal-sensitive transcriptional regulator [Chloroflexi bacterium]|nr:metal-sensitive transcriptional regulator [Chloroflexota bacterium]
MQSSTSEQALKRLSYIEGHLAGIRRMIDEEKYCVDILKQTHAVRRAIEKMEALLLGGHLGTCVVDGIKQGREEQIIAELRDLYTVGGR